jgi:hypothetical protein
MKQLSAHGTDISNILNWVFLLKSAEKIHIWLKSGKNDRHFT